LVSIVFISVSLHPYIRQDVLINIAVTFITLGVEYTLGVKMTLLEVLSAIASFSGLIYLAYTARKMQNTAFWMEKLEEGLDEIHSNTQIQQKIYQLGGLVGQGIAAGTGLTRNKKMGTTDLIGMAMQYFLPKVATSLGGSNPMVTQPPQGEQGFGQAS